MKMQHQLTGSSNNVSFTVDRRWVGEDFATLAPGSIESVAARFVGDAEPVCEASAAGGPPVSTGESSATSDAVVFMVAPVLQLFIFCSVSCGCPAGDATLQSFDGCHQSSTRDPEAGDGRVNQPPIWCKASQS